jgi:hypothetical protein
MLHLKIVLSLQSNYNEQYKICYGSTYYDLIG